MQVINQVLADKLKEILDLQAQIKSMETRYNSLLKADESFETLKEIRLKIKYLHTQLETKEKDAMTLFN